MTRISKSFRITSKHQVTIPQNVMAELDLKEGDYVYFSKSEHGITLKKDMQQPISKYEFADFINLKLRNDFVLTVTGGSSYETAPIIESVVIPYIYHHTLNSFSSNEHGVIEKEKVSDILLSHKHTEDSVLILDNVLNVNNTPLRYELAITLFQKFKGKIIIRSEKESDHLAYLQALAISSIDLKLDGNLPKQQFEEFSCLIEETLRSDGMAITTNISFNNTSYVKGSTTYERFLSEIAKGVPTLENPKTLTSTGLVKGAPLGQTEDSENKDALHRATVEMFDDF